MVQAARLHEVLHSLLERPPPGVQVHVDTDACCAIPAEAQNLPLRRRVVWIETLPHQQLLAVKRPSFREYRVAVLPANLIGNVIRNRYLQEMSGNALMAQDGARIFDRRANVEVVALRVIGWDEIETARILVIDTGRIHEAAGRGRLERFGKLADFEGTDIRGDRDQPVRLQEVDDLREPRLVRGKKLRLVLRNVLGARRIG